MITLRGPDVEARVAIPAEYSWKGDSTQIAIVCRTYNRYLCSTHAALPPEVPST